MPDIAPEPLSCPFCCGKPHVIEGAESSWTIVCRRCGVRFDLEDEPRVDAINRWNRRDGLPHLAHTLAMVRGGESPTNLGVLVELARNLEELDVPRKVTLEIDRAIAEIQCYRRADSQRFARTS